MTTRMPARWHSATAATASGRGGSISPTRPSKVKRGTMSAMLRSLVPRRQLTLGQRQHTLPIARRLVHPGLPGRAVQRRARGVVHTQVQHPLRRALEQHEHLGFVVVVQRGHVAVFGLERDFVAARKGQAGVCPASDPP